MDLTDKELLVKVSTIVDGINGKVDELKSDFKSLKDETVSDLRDRITRIETKNDRLEKFVYGGGVLVFGILIKTIIDLMKIGT